ncbi:MAG: hypothetical protein AAB531_02095 [Patescibacteria group bacterium]
MDRFIKFFEEASVSQKLLITGGFCAFLLFLMGASYLLTNYNINTVPKDTSAENNADLPADDGSKSDDGEWEVYTGETYKLSYPQDLSLEAGEVSDGGQEILLKGKHGSTNYTIELQVLDNTTSSVVDIHELFRSFKYQEENIVMGGLETKIFSGKIDKPWEKAVAVEYKGNIYKLQFSYESEQQSPQMEEIFRQVIDRFSFI